MKMKSEDILNNLMIRYPVLRNVQGEIWSSYRCILECFQKGGKLLLCGNGGSAADSLHIAGELMKSFVLKRNIDEKIGKRLSYLFPEESQFLVSKLEGALPAIPLTGSTAVETAFANDVEASLSYAQQIYALGNEGDVLLGISTSGNAENVKYAAMMARAKDMKMIGLTGRSGGKLKEYCHYCICVNEEETYRVQELHLPVYHAICQMVEAELWGTY